MPLKSKSRNACVGENTYNICIYIHMYISHIRINRLDKLREDFKIRFWVIDNTHVPDWLVAAFDMIIDNKRHESYLEDELTEMHVDLEVKAFIKSRNFSQYWNNINTATKCPDLGEAAELLLLASPSSYKVEAGLSHVNANLTRQRNTLCLQNRGELQLCSTNFQLNIDNLAASHRAH